VFIELLNQMDGFDQTTNVKVIMSTNRGDTFGPALLRPGHLDRKIEFPLPDRWQKRLIFQTITARMNLAEDVDLEQCNLVLILDVSRQIASVAQTFINMPVGRYVRCPKEPLCCHTTGL
jgi:ATP-dependent 26S proteasome regulatory subunit